MSVLFFFPQLKRLYTQLDIGVRFAGLSFNVVECKTEVGMRPLAGGGLAEAPTVPGPLCVLFLW